MCSRALAMGAFIPYASIKQSDDSITGSNIAYTDFERYEFYYDYSTCQ